MTEQFRFELDTPNCDTLGAITRFSGWCFDAGGRPATSIVLYVNDSPRSQLLPSHRIDLKQAFPEKPFASGCGFEGDLVMTDDLRASDHITAEIVLSFADGSNMTAARHEYVFRGDPPTFHERPTDYSLANLLAPRTEFEAIAGALHFHDGGVPMVRLLDQKPTHAYGRLAQSLIAEVPKGGIFLDFGCGIKAASDLHPNAVLLDAVHFPGVDIACTSAKLPFRDEIFDLVVSQAVYEHLADPGQVTRELHRVLKPGGHILIDTAFMQPLHGDPDHYNNMTLSALKRLMGGFTIEQEGIQPHQMPSFGLRMQIEAVLPFMRDGDWKARFDHLLRELNKSGADLDRDLGPMGQKTLAAGVFVLARKRSSG
jgi:SAM-dependent methyltransferase